MKKALSLILLLAVGITAFAQDLVSYHGDRNYPNRQYDALQNQVTIVEVGGTAELYLPSRIRELRPTSVTFRSNDYVDVSRQTREYCTIRGRKSVRATQVICRYRWEEVSAGKKIPHEDFYTFNIAVLRVEPEAVNIDQELVVGWDCETVLRPVLYPENAECGFTYRSSDTKVATVSTRGVVRGVSLGEADITITTTTGLTTETHIRVAIPECESISFDTPSKHFEEIGDEMDLSVTIKPLHAEPQLRWESSDPDIISVDDQGHIRALAPGKAAIWLRTDNGKQHYKNFKIKEPKK